MRNKIKVGSIVRVVASKAKKPAIYRVVGLEKYLGLIPAADLVRVRRSDFSDAVNRCKGVKNLPLFCLTVFEDK